MLKSNYLKNYSLPKKNCDCPSTFFKSLFCKIRFYLQKNYVLHFTTLYLSTKLSVNIDICSCGVLTKKTNYSGIVVLPLLCLQKKSNFHTSCNYPAHNPNHNNTSIRLQFNFLFLISFMQKSYLSTIESPLPISHSISGM